MRPALPRARGRDGLAIQGCRPRFGTMRASLPNLLRRSLPALGLALLVAGCASTKINWNARVGEYTFDQAVLDYGPTDK